MENKSIIFRNFGCVPCGQKAVETIKIENDTKNVRVIKIERRGNSCLEQYDRVRIHPIQAVTQPKKLSRFTLTYVSDVEDVTDNFCFNVFDCEKPIAQLKAHAHSVGPSLSPKTFNLKFFHFKLLNQTVRHVEITNTTKCEAKFYFDIDEDSEQFDVTPRSGVIPAEHKLGLKLTFNSSGVGIYFKKLFCIVQFHEPIIFNCLGIYQPKLKIEPKSLTFKYPFEPLGLTGYEAYMIKAKKINLPEGEKIPKCVEESKTVTSDETILEEPCIDESKPALPEKPLENKYWSKNAVEVFLTNNFIDIKNSSEVVRATSLVNLSLKDSFYFEWDIDPRNHFHIEPSKGLLEPNSRNSFTIYFAPSILDNLYHFEADVKIFPCKNENENDVYLPLTMSLRIIGNSFQGDGCGWIAQCKITPKMLLLRACVPDKTVYGTFVIERQGHLPFSYFIMPPKDPNFTVQPPLGYLSKDFHLFVVQFNSESRQPGVYTEDLKIKFNNSDSNIETIKIVISVEKPTLILGDNNSLTFTPIFPGSKTAENIYIENPTNLHLSYEFKIPEDITWTEIVNPAGVIEPKSFDEVEIIFKPETPCEYLDYIPCYISSTSKKDHTEIIQLQLIGSCQYGYLVATPSTYDFGECIYKEKHTVKIHLFNFSPISLFFRLTTHGTFGDSERDMVISPSAGYVPAKGSLKVKIGVIPHEIDIFDYEIKCQNFENDCKEAAPCDDPLKIFSCRFEGVLPTFQVVDINIENGGPLFSPHWLWKMLCIDKMNKALKSVEPEQEIHITLPEAESESPMMSINLLLEASRHGEINWNASVEINCPCDQQSENSVQELTECFHKKLVTLSPHSRKVNPKNTIISTIALKYNFKGEIAVQIIINLPYERKLVLKTALRALSEEGPLNPSVYFRSPFCLKPVFIGDTQPPLQLFWLYNNTQKHVSYSLDNLALREATTIQGIFDCVNPIGDLPPFSSTPLGFVFSPNELISYSADVVLCKEEENPICIRLLGEGSLNIQLPETEKTIPTVTKLKSENCALECCASTINIPFFGLFTQIKRFFLLKNNSKTKEMAFAWHMFNCENIFTALVEPEKGVIKPREEVLMTLSIQSHSHPTFVTFSIPCDVISYSELKAYEMSLRIRDKMTEMSKDYFIITDKGISYETPEYPISKKPDPYHIFLTVNATIVSSLNIDEKLTPGQQSIMRAENELPNNIKSELLLKSTALPFIQEFFEKLLWNTLCSNNATSKIKAMEKSQDYVYLQILPDHKKQTEEAFKRLMALPEKSLIQSILESRLKEALCKHFVAEQCQMSTEMPPQ